MKFWFALVVSSAFLFTPLASYAQCEAFDQDGFAPKPVMPIGPLKGRCLDTSNKRPLYVLEPQSIWEGAPDRVVVANVRHKDRWWIADLNLAQLSSVALVLEYFEAPIPAAHSMLRMRFQHPQKLQSQQNKEIQDQVRDLIFSVEAVGAPGEGFNLNHGLFGNYAIVWRLVSLEEMYRYVVLQQRHKTKQMRLALTHPEEKNLFWDLIRTSQFKGLTSLYHTIKNNCSTTLFESIDRAIAPHRSFLRTAIKGPTVFWPNLNEIALRIRGIGDRKNKLPPLDQDPSAQASISTF